MKDHKKYKALKLNKNKNNTKPGTNFLSVECGSKDQKILSEKPGSNLVKMAVKTWVKVTMSYTQAYHPLSSPVNTSVEKIILKGGD